MRPTTSPASSAANASLATSRSGATSVDHDLHAAVGDQADRAVELVAQHVARPDELDLVEHDARRGQQRSLAERVADGRRSARRGGPAGRPARSSARGRRCRRRRRSRRRPWSPAGRPRRPASSPSAQCRPRSERGGQRRGRSDRRRRRGRPPRRDLQRVDADAAEADDRDARPGGDAAARDHGAIGGAERAGQRRGMGGVDAGGTMAQAVERRHDLLLEAAGLGEAGAHLGSRGRCSPSPGAAAVAAPAGPDVVDDDHRARRERPGRIGLRRTRAQISWPGTCGSARSCAERHPAARDLHVAEAHPAGEHLEQRVAGRELIGAGRSSGSSGWP